MVVGTTSRHIWLVVMLLSFLSLLVLGLGEFLAWRKVVFTVHFFRCFSFLFFLLFLVGSGGGRGELLGM